MAQYWAITNPLHITILGHYSASTFYVMAQYWASTGPILDNFSSVQRLVLAMYWPSTGPIPVHYTGTRKKYNLFKNKNIKFSFVKIK